MNPTLVANAYFVITFLSINFGIIDYPESGFAIADIPSLLLLFLLRICFDYYYCVPNFVGVDGAD